MDGTAWLIIVGAIIIGGAITAGLASLGEATLPSSFVALGDMSYKTRSEIIAAVGQPNAISDVGMGVELLQWQNPGYHIAIQFEGEVFKGISHESAQQV
jgi:hypothetical protein